MHLGEIGREALMICLALRTPETEICYKQVCALKLPHRADVHRAQQGISRANLSNPPPNASSRGIDVPNDEFSFRLVRSA